MKITEYFNRYKELLLYLAFGVATTAVNFVVYTLAVHLFRLNMTISNAIAWLCAVIFAFITNKQWVFHSHTVTARVLFKELVSFFGARILSGIIEIVAPEWLYSLGVTADLFGIQGITAKLIVSVVVIILNYLFSKWWIFRS